MSEILTIDTGVGIVPTEQIDPLPLFDDNHPMLKEVMPEYTEPIPNPVMTRLIKQLRMTMRKFGGMGLSANQCGVRVRVFVIGYGDYNLTCINPKIINRSAEMIKSNEGCLSFPGLFVKVPRPAWIEVEFTNENGETVRTRLEGLTARCYEHELDHMNGVKFIELVGPLALKMAKQKQSKLLKTTQRKLKKKDGLFV
jgi:peptide deformylase